MIIAQWVAYIINISIPDPCISLIIVDMGHLAILICSITGSLLICGSFLEWAESGTHTLHWLKIVTYTMSPGGQISRTEPYAVLIWILNL